MPPPRRPLPPVAFSSTETPPRPAPARRGGRALPTPEEVLADPKDLTTRQAERLTQDIRERNGELWFLLDRAYRGRAPEALGFGSWKDYTTQALGISESRSFQLLDQAKVMRELAEAGAPAEEFVAPPSRVVQAVKNDLPTVRKRALQALRRGETIADAMREYAAELDAARATPKAPRKSEARRVTCPCCDGAGLVNASDARAMRRLLDRS